MALVGTISPGFITGFKNRIINGDFSVAQRGTTFTNITNANHIDMWSQSDGGGFTANISQQSATSGDNSYFSSGTFLRYKKNSAVISAIVIKIEDLQQFNNKTFTLSYWARSSDAAVTPALTPYTVNDGSSYNSYMTQSSISVPTLSSTWQKYEHRLVFSNMYTYGFSGSHHLRLQLFDNATAGTYDIAEVQLEEGSVATKFEKRPFVMELQMCKRYYQKSYNYATVPGSSVSFNQMDGRTGLSAVTNTSGELMRGVRFPVEMRGSPAVTIYDRAGTSGKATGTQYMINDYNNISAAVQEYTATGFTYNVSGYGTALGGISAAWTADASL